MTVNQSDGTVYAAGYSAPKFPEELEVFPYEIEGIFTTPFLAVIPTDTSSSVTGYLIDDSVYDLALPLSIVWTGDGIDACMGADISGNGTVNFEDFAYLANQWLKNPNIPSADIYPIAAGDGNVNISDLMILSEYWLKSGCN